MGGGEIFFWLARIYTPEPEFAEVLRDSEFQTVRSSSWSRTTWPAIQGRFLSTGSSKWFLDGQLVTN